MDSHRLLTERRMALYQYLQQLEGVADIKPAVSRRFL